MSVLRRYVSPSATAPGSPRTFGVGAAIAVGLIGFRTVEAVGRNPQAQGKILPLALVLGAFAEGLGILAMILLNK